MAGEENAEREGTEKERSEQVKGRTEFRDRYVWDNGMWEPDEEDPKWWWSGEQGNVAVAGMPGVPGGGGTVTKTGGGNV